MNVTAEGIRISVDGRERFMPFERFPWFKDATIAQILNVEHEFEDDLRWPDLDIDLHVESIDHPERFPLLWRPGRAESGTPSSRKSKVTTRKGGMPVEPASRSRTGSRRGTHPRAAERPR